MNEILKQLGNLFIITGGAITVRTVTGSILWKIMEQTNKNRLYRAPNYIGDALDVITIIGGFVIYKQVGY